MHCKVDTRMWSGYVQIFSTTALIRMPDIKKSWTNVKNFWFPFGYMFQAEKKKKDMFRRTETYGSLSGTDHTKWLSHVLMTEHRRAGSRCTFWLHPRLILGDYQGFVDFTARKSRYMGQGRNSHIIQISPDLCNQERRNLGQAMEVFRAGVKIHPHSHDVPAKRLLHSVFSHMLYTFFKEKA